MVSLLVMWFLTGLRCDPESIALHHSRAGLHSSLAFVAPGMQAVLAHPHLLRCLPVVKLSTALLIKTWLPSLSLHQPRTSILLSPLTPCPGEGLLLSQTIRRQKVLLSLCLSFEEHPLLRYIL